MPPKKIRLHRRRMTRPGIKRGTTLRPPTMAGHRMGEQVGRLIDRMYRQTVREVKALFNNHDLPTAVTMDASIASAGRRIFNRLERLFGETFNTEAPEIAEQMVNAADRQSQTTLGRSLREMSGDKSFRANFDTAGVNDVFTASVAESVGLIKRIPQEFLQEVQGEVMRSITTGSGMQDLLPYMEKKYGEATRHAANVAMDQTRKAYNGLTRGRMRKVGARKYEWMHSGGSNHPREYHRDTLNGQIFDIDDPPISNPKTGFRGNPGDEPFCRCSMRPIISFEANDDE